MDISNSDFDQNKAELNANSDNSLVTSGGAIGVNTTAECNIQYSRFTNNFAVDVGGAIFSRSNDFQVSNSLFVDNIAFLGIGGALEFISSTPTVSNCTFANNEIEPSAFISNNQSDATICNSIFWGTVSVSPIFDAGASPSVINCIVQGGYLLSNTV